MRTARYVAVATVLGAALVGCKGGARSAPRDAGGPPADAAVDGRAAAVLDAPDATPPSDEASPPPPGDELVTRAKHLMEAITQGDAALASDILFPRDGWLETRDAADPGKDWERQVDDPFRRSVHALSGRRPSLEHAQVVSLELGRVLVQATPRKHGWRRPVWTARGSRLTFVVDGHTRTLSIREMAAWRGAWYVTRLR